METSNGKDWKKIREFIILMYLYGYTSEFISIVLELDILYVYGVLLQNYGTAGWKRKD
jgi:hypothetical protein